MAITRIWDADNGVWQFVGGGLILPALGYMPGSPIYYTVSGNFDKANYPGMVAALVECQGAGGGSAGCAATAAGQNSVGGGGFGGGYARSITPVSNLDPSEAVTVGARGAAGAAGGNGGAGGDSIFDTISGEVRGVGGPPGTAIPFLSFPAVGDPSGSSNPPGGTGDQIELGGAPSAPMALALNTLIGSKGGGSHFSSGIVRRVTGVTVAGVAETIPGVGATGPQNAASQGAQAGQLGGPGIVIVTPLYAADSIGPTGPKGVLGYAEVLSSQGSITTETDVTGLTTTVTVGPGSRRLKISGYGRMFSSVAGDRFIIDIREGAAYLGKTGDFSVNLTSGTNLVFAASTVVTAIPGVHTYKLTVRRISGTGAGTHVGDAASPAFILVEDIGAA